MFQLSPQDAAVYAHMQAAQMQGSMGGHVGFSSAPPIGGMMSAGASKGSKAVAKAPAPAEEEWGIPGLSEALDEALAPWLAMEVQWTPEQTKNKITTKIVKATTKFTKEQEDKILGRATTTQAQALVEQFVETIMSTVSGGFYEKDYFPKIDFSASMLASVLFAFKDGKVFQRTLMPMIPLYVQEGLDKWHEEERIQKVMYDVLELCAVKDEYRKKCLKALTSSFDDAFMKSPYGTNTGETAGLCMLKDYVRGWIHEFVGRGWEVIQNGSTATTRDEQILFVTVLFQHLTDPNQGCVPREVVAQLDGLPPAPWAFIAEVAEEIFKENENPAKRRKGGGKGW